MDRTLMLERRYFRDVAGSMNSSIIWERQQLFKFFPYPPRLIYSMIEQCGFSPELYRASWPDLVANLPSDLWSVPHFVQYLEQEIKIIRGFSIRLDFDALRNICRLPISSGFWKASLIRNLIQAEIDFDKECVYDERWWIKALSALQAVGSPLLIIGDSHSLIYRQTVKDHLGRVSVPLHIFCGGGSAIGLSNPNSRSGYSTRLEKIFRALSSSSDSGMAPPVCFAFGQVDTEFVYTYKRLREHQEKFIFNKAAIFLKIAAESYLAWLDTLGSAKVFIIGVNPPCVDDVFIYDSYSIQMSTYHQSNLMNGESGEEVAALIGRMKRLEFPDKRVRTALHSIFNEHLKERSRALGFCYLDTFKAMMGADGCIDAKYAFALDGEELKQGANGQDIHVAGDHSRRLKAMIVKSITRITRRWRKTPSLYGRITPGHAQESSP